MIVKLQTSQRFVSSSISRRSNDHRPHPHTADMDSIKKKMEKLSNETREAENRIAHFESVKAANEAEAEKFEEQLRVVQKKIQAMESQFDVSTEVHHLLLQIFCTYNSIFIVLWECQHGMTQKYNITFSKDLFNTTLKLEGMEKKAGNAESDVSALRYKI